MSHSRRTLRLNSDWDICLNAVGRLALSQGEAATAQNVANEIRLFTNDAYFFQDQGLPHFLMELGQKPQLSLLRGEIRRAAFKTGDVKEIWQIDLQPPDPPQRGLQGSLEFSSIEGSAHGKIRTYF